MHSQSGIVFFIRLFLFAHAFETFKKQEVSRVVETAVMWSVSKQTVMKEECYYEVS